MVDLLVQSPRARSVSQILRTHDSAVPAHFDAEVLSGIGRLARAGTLDPQSIPARLRKLGETPLRRHPLADLLEGAWSRRHNLRLADGLYVTLAAQLGGSLLTSDARLARSSTGVDVILPEVDT